MQRILLGAILLCACNGSDMPERMGQLTDAELEELCEPVERQIECGIIGAVYSPSRAKRQCISDLERLRDGETTGCLRVSDVMDCRTSECADRESGPCARDCPEYEACWEHGVEDCPTKGGFCRVVSATKYDETNSCNRRLDAYCMPTNAICGGTATALDVDGSCWLMESACPVPEGWTNRTDACSFGGPTC